MPQSIFQFKPIYTDAFLTGILSPYNSDQPGLSFGAISELYINFSYFGIIPAGIIIGYFIKNIDYYFFVNKSSVATLFFYLTFGIYYFQLFVGGFYTVTILEFFLSIILSKMFIFILRFKL